MVDLKPNKQAFSHHMTLQIHHYSLATPLISIDSPVSYKINMDDPPSIVISTPLYFLFSLILARLYHSYGALALTSEVILPSIATLFQIILEHAYPHSTAVSSMNPVFRTSFLICRQETSLFFGKKKKSLM